MAVRMVEHLRQLNAWGRKLSSRSMSEWVSWTRLVAEEFSSSSSCRGGSLFRPGSSFQVGHHRDAKKTTVWFDGGWSKHPLAM